MEKNPFLEEKKVHKPFQKEQLTETQRERNLKGIRMVQKNLKKVKGQVKGG